MEITLSELAALVGGQLASGADGSLRITGAAALAEAGPGDVTFFGSPKYLPQLRTSKATAAFVPADFAEGVPAVCIRCENPALAFAKYLDRIAPAPVVFPPGIHPSAVIGQDVRLGENVSIQPCAVIEEGAQIGDRTIIGAHAYIGHNARLGADTFLHARVTVGERCLVGNRVILHSGVVIGSDGFGFVLRDGRQVKIPQTGIVQVDDDVEIGANTCLDRARFGRTWVQEGTKIDNMVQVAHNVVIGKHGIVCALTAFAGSTTVGDYVTFGGQAATAGHLHVADKTIVGARCGVNKSLPGNQIYMGTPAIPAQEWREQKVHIHGLGKLKARVKELERLLAEKKQS